MGVFFFEKKKKPNQTVYELSIVLTKPFKKGKPEHLNQNRLGKS